MNTFDHIFWEAEEKSESNVGRGREGSERREKLNHLLKHEVRKLKHARD